MERTDFNRVTAILRDSMVEYASEEPVLTSEVQCSGSVDLWDYEGMNSISFRFDPSGKLIKFVINDSDGDIWKMERI